MNQPNARKTSGNDPRHAAWGRNNLCHSEATTNCTPAKSWLTAFTSNSDSIIPRMVSGLSL